MCDKWESHYIKRLGRHSEFLTHCPIVTQIVSSWQAFWLRWSIRILFCEWLVSNNVSDPEWHMQLTLISQLWHAKGNFRSQQRVQCSFPAVGSAFTHHSANLSTPTIYLLFWWQQWKYTDVSGINGGVRVIGGGLLCKQGRLADRFLLTTTRRERELHCMFINSTSKTGRL